MKFANLPQISSLQTCNKIFPSTISCLMKSHLFLKIKLKLSLSTKGDSFQTYRSEHMKLKRESGTGNRCFRITRIVEEFSPGVSRWFSIGTEGREGKGAVQAVVGL